MSFNEFNRDLVRIIEIKHLFELNRIGQVDRIKTKLTNMSETLD